MPMKMKGGGGMDKLGMLMSMLSSLKMKGGSGGSWGGGMNNDMMMMMMDCNSG